MGFLYLLLGVSCYADTSVQKSASLPVSALHIDHPEYLLHVRQGLQLLGKKEITRVRITQIGDSHTAGDYWTHAFRKKLQNHYGSAGLGFVYPLQPHYARSAQLSYAPAKNSYMVQELLHQKTHHQYHESYGLFGVLLKPAKYKKQMTVDYQFKSDIALHAPMRIQVLTSPSTEFSMQVQSHNMEPQSQINTAHLKTHVFNLEQILDGFSIRVPAQKQALFYGLSIDYPQSPGVIVDNIGLNGTQVKHLLMLDNSIIEEEFKQLKSDLIILAFGTNESFESSFDPVLYERELRQVIARIKQYNPQADILLIAPPDAHALSKTCRKQLKIIKKTKHLVGRELMTYFDCQPSFLELDTESACHWSPPAALAQVRAIQKYVSDTAHVAFFEWPEYIQAPCAMMSWMLQDKPLAAYDHVHLTTAGYEILADVLYQALLN